MSTSRAESQQPQFNRRRSNTAQSLLRPVPPPVPCPPLEIGDTVVLNSWVHDPKDNQNVTFNHARWPGITEGEMISVTANGMNESFFFIVPKDDGSNKPQLQISVPKPLAESFGVRNNGEVTLIKVDRELHCADYVEFIFQDQYMGRNEMWRLGEHLAGQCVYTDQEVNFIGSGVAKIQCIFVDGKKVSAACMTSRTKAIYRSLSAKVTIFIQVCRELWEFAGDGERYNEKIVHSFLPSLFAKWKEAGTNHTVTIALISRVYYDESEIDYAAGPLRRDDRGQWYKDFYKVITDLEVIYEWKPTLVSLKNSFWDFQRDILLTHHYHRAHLEGSSGSSEQVRLVGRLSYAHDGPILEALNLGLNPAETHYIDRSLLLTGAATMLITPGTGYFRVSKHLLRLTTTRMLDQGFGLDLICLEKPPLHSSPIFSFQGVQPDSKVAVPGSREMDPLWGGDDDSSHDARTKATFWWEPFWISVSFWDKQMDLPFRQDRFIAQAKMHEIQMLGLLEHDVLSSIEVPYLTDDPEPTPHEGAVSSGIPLTLQAAHRFDNDVFTLRGKSQQAPAANRNSATSSASPPSTSRMTAEKRPSHRNSLVAPKIPPIEESPKICIAELPPEDTPDLSSSALFAKTRTSSPSQSSIRSLRSNLSTYSSKRSTKKESPSRESISSKFAPSWLFKPFRSGPVEPQTTTVSASAISTPHTDTTSSPPTLSSSVSTSSSLVDHGPHVPQPMAIKGRGILRPSLNRMFENDTLSTPRPSGRPTGSSPKNDLPSILKRRGTTSSITASWTSSSPSSRANPSNPQTIVSYVQSSLAARWQHTFPQPSYKHEIKWKAIVTPGCLPLSVEYFPTTAELENAYDVFSYDFVVDPGEMRSCLVKPPMVKGNAEDQRRAWALVVMRGMAAVRLAQGFQFVLQRKQKSQDVNGMEEEEEEKSTFRRHQSFVGLTDDDIPKPWGAAEVLKSTANPVYLSMSNEIHRISYTGEAIQVRRYVRRMPSSQPFHYECLIWPKLGVGYTQQSTTFTSHGLENYGWNRLDMLVAGYEHQFNESLRYWRTRFVVIPTVKLPTVSVGPAGETLNEEEIRILGIEKLAEHFTKVRWQPPDEKQAPPPVRFLPTTHSPAASVLDNALMDQLDQIHAAGPLRKKMKSEREIGDMSLASIAKAMREEDGVPIKHNQWHRSRYPDSFTGFDFVSWLCREFRDVSSRSQGTEWGIRLQEQGLFEHVRGHHNFLDGHYFYRLIGEYAIPSTPRSWFGPRLEATNLRAGIYPSSVARPKHVRQAKKRLILSQSMVIDIDTTKRSDQAETVVLHHDIIHNPATVFHFELQWIGTTGRYIEDQLRQWNKTIERYGLKLVEAYVTQISDIRDRNAFQSCFPLRLALPPPIVPDLQSRVPEGTQTAHYFEYALLRNFGFILDVEASDLYPEQVDVVYSYRRSPYKYSQFVHRSGVAFIQVVGGSQGFLFLTNRLMGPGRMGTTMRGKEMRPAAAADDIRVKLHNFCSDKEALDKFYDTEIALLRRGPDDPPDPPPLSI
ncbi:uncharacterized protein BT62DRAFT_1059883 [Guyanagaster necrorhizus]|uniref:Vacuolar membrane-associated protein IML1 n=1 Tax=Guyanagaster necrorhizus TaxID=856835 RepID=A0A9P8AVW3_9AGAR|nr:uncharacterized protein BT62DRAFT_1059883 [Guyanagaster necrorhizus MCA 3950]KAG7448312.1 hypothetical protein BT62DRAFT_1059883 [Guyanagaster necrorhizus MCA 3950]